MKKKLAFGIAGASAALIAGWRIIQSESESAFSGAGEEASGESAPDGPAAPKPSSDPGPEPATSAGSSNGGPQSAEPDADVPEEASKAELYEIAQGLKIKGRSKMSKTELRRAIEDDG